MWESLVRYVRKLKWRDFCEGARCQRMPPSPALRCSPGRELRMENNHKRGHSLESGLHIKVKDDDLTLFNDMQMRERDNFLLHSNDDFDDSLSKLRCFSDYKFTVPSVRGESSDLLNANTEKNDYDWLLTPPDTPLFPSLDDDEPPPVNLVSRGRPRTQSISIPRSSMSEKSQRTSRSSASPRQLSPSPRSGNSVLHSRGRPSSAPHSSPTPVLRPTTPSRRPSTPPNKPSTSTPRSSTPPLRRISSGSSVQSSSSGKRGTSPVKTSRGNSSSPKLQGWQSNLPGFSSDPPPNLRTSLSDRPASHVRGFSPVPRNGRDLSKLGRQSMSPTASRSASSSQSHDRDGFSSHSRGSIASSGDDDVDSLHSVNVGISGSPTPRKNGVFANHRAVTYPKKTSRTPSSSSAPKRSFDSALRQMDQHKTPQNMFRPLLSSVPATTFYSGKANTALRPMFSRNSSLTTSSNAISEQGASVAPDTVGSEHYQNDLTGEWEKLPTSDAQEEVFIFDKVDEVNEDIQQEVSSEKLQNAHGDPGGSMEQKTDSEDLEMLAFGLVDTAVVVPALESVHAAGDQFGVDFIEMMATCIKCLKNFHVFRAVDGSVDVCQKCAEKDGLIPDGLYTAGLTETTLLVSQSTEIHPDIPLIMDASCEEPQLGMSTSDLPEQTDTQTLVGQPQNNVDRNTDCLPNNCLVELVTVEKECHLPEHQVECQEEVASTSPDSGNNFQRSQFFSSNQNLSIDSPEGTDEKERHFPDHQLESQKEMVSTSSDSGNKFQQLQSFSSNQSLKIDSPEGTGISLLLLKRSTSSKGPVVQGRAFAATNVFCAEPSYARDNLNGMKGSVTWESSSASSSIDLSSSRQTEARVQRQLSRKKGDTGYVRNDFSMKPQSSELFLSRISNNSNEDLTHAYKTMSAENFGCSAGAFQCVTQEESLVITEECMEALGNTNSFDNNCSSTRSIVSVGDKKDLIESSEVMDISPPELCHTEGIHIEIALAAGILNDEHYVSSLNVDERMQNESSTRDIDMPAEISDSCFVGEGDMTNGSLCETDISGNLMCSSVAMVGLEDDSDGFNNPQTECEASQSASNIIEASDAHSASTTLEMDILDSSLESNNVDCAHGIHEESTVMVETPGGHKSRSLTLEEATDTILFCSSIIHDLAYKAAGIGMEKENSPPREASRPTVTILGKSVFEQNDQKKTSTKHMPKTPKAKRKRLEIDAKLPLTESGNDVKNHEFSTRSAELPHKVDSTKPPKLESKCNCTVM